MWLMKVLKINIIIVFSFILSGVALLYYWFKLITHPKRILFLYNVIKRKRFSRDGKPPPDKWNDPSLGQHGFLRLKGVRLHYVASGDEDNPLMLFIHGLMGCWYSWRFQMREFSKHYRVVAIDQRGYSLSDCPEGRSNYTWLKYSTDVADVIEAFGYHDCVLVGTELGAIVAMTTAMRYPEKVSKLIVFNSVLGSIFIKNFGEELSDVKFVIPHLLAAIPYLPEFLLSFNDFISFECMFRSPKNAIRKEIPTKEDLEVYKYAFSQKGCIYAVCNSYRNLLRQKKLSSEVEIINWKILHIYGSQYGWIKKSMVDQFEKCCPNGVFKTVKGGTHYIHQDRPDVVNQLMKEFLDNYDSN